MLSSCFKLFQTVPIKSKSKLQMELIYYDILLVQRKYSDNACMCTRNLEKSWHWVLLWRFIVLSALWQCLNLVLFSSKSYNLHQTQTFVGHLLYTRRISDIVDITMSYIIYGFQDFANAVVSQRIFTYYRHRISSSPIHWEPDASILDEQQCDKCIIYAYRLFLDSWYLVLYKNSWSTH